MAIMRHTERIYSDAHPGADYIQELCEKPAFQDALSKLRSKWGIDVANEIFLNEKYPDLAEGKKLLKNKKFIADLVAFQKSFDLGEEWSTFMQTYIFMDVLTYKKESELFIEKRKANEADQITSKPAYYLRIFPETTQEDVAKAWPSINEFMGGSKVRTVRQKTTKNLERDRTIYQMAKLDMPIEDISNFLEKYYGLDFDYARIKSAEARYRKRMGIKEANKLGYRKNK